MKHKRWCTPRGNSSNNITSAAQSKSAAGLNSNTTAGIWYLERAGLARDSQSSATASAARMGCRLLRRCAALCRKGQPTVRNSTRSTWLLSIWTRYTRGRQPHARQGADPTGEVAAWHRLSKEVWAVKKSAANVQSQHVHKVSPHAGGSPANGANHALDVNECCQQAIRHRGAGCEARDHALCQNVQKPTSPPRQAIQPSQAGKPHLGAIGACS